MEFIYLPDQLLILTAVIECMVLPNNVASEQSDVIISIVAAMISLFSLIATIWIFRHNGRQNRRAIKHVMEDLLRHFKINLDIYDMMDLSRGKPSSAHFSKCKIDESSLIFNVDTYKSIKPKYLPMFNKVILNYRNGNLEIDAICSYLKNSGDKYDLKVMKQYVDIMAKERQKKLYAKTKEFLEAHYGHYNEKNGHGVLPEIIYEESVWKNS